MSDVADSDGQLKPIPVAEFEGEFVRSFESKLPAIALDMAEGYPRGTHLVFEVESRVRNVGYVEDKRGDLVRQHNLALEEVRLKDAFDPAHRRSNVGGTSAGDAWVEELLGFLEGEHDELNFDGEEIPERLREMLKAYSEAFGGVSTSVGTPGAVEEGGRPDWVRSTLERSQSPGEVGF